MITRSPTSDFELSLQENLALFCTPPPNDLFNSTREIAIARLALNSQAEAYYSAISVLSQLLHDRLHDLDDTTQHNNALLSPNSPKKDPTNTLHAILQIISTIETKSSQLINAANNVTHLLGKAVSIDVDKAALHSLLLNLPQLVNDSISQITNDATLATQVSSHLSDKIDSMLVAIRFSDSNDSAANGATQGITVEQYTALIESVPTAAR